jgi:GH35 family endo-1,4-beta-xylanase
MIQFEVYHDGKLAEDMDLSGAYVFGQDTIPIRADITVAKGLIRCTKRVPGPAGLAVLWDVGQAGVFMLPTVRLPERKKPYNLLVEMARAQLFKVIQKREDWGLFDFEDAMELNDSFDDIRKTFLRAIHASDPAEASSIGAQALSDAITLGEKMALFHADIFLRRRKASAQSVGRTSFGTAVDLSATNKPYNTRLQEVADFFSIPLAWKNIEPKEQVYDFAQTDKWIDFAARAKRPVHAGPLLSFSNLHLPERLYIWEHDYEALRDLLYEYIQNVVTHYKGKVKVWNVVSGIHGNNTFNLSFDQLMELTRMSCLLVKKLDPQAKVMIELVMPWGEYYARNQRSIPPLMYADMAVQSGVKFDAFGVQMLMGVPKDGHYVRDLLQISAMLDEFVAFGKTVHVSACQVPSNTTTDPADAWDGTASISEGGKWYAPWSPRLQAEWLQAFYRIGISKPFVESVCWGDLADRVQQVIPHGGLCSNAMEPKLAFRELRNFKKTFMHGNGAPKDPPRRAP